MSALVPFKIIDSLEAYLVLNKPITAPGSKLTIYLLAKNHGGVHSFKARFSLVHGEKRSPVSEVSITLGERESKSIAIDFGAPEKPGRYGLELTIDEKKHDYIEFIVANPSSRKPFLFTIVWHNHQAPNYTPDSRIHSPWAYVYVWGAYLTPYGLGPYHYHAVLLNKYRDFKATYNLSPSLLYQWIKAIEHGVVFITGEQYDSESPEINKVKETLELYKEALYRGQIDVLTSIYAHTIAGFLIDVLDAGDIVDEEIAFGKKITAEAFGRKYDVKGLWTPEMAFSMGLVSIYAANGIEYTVLDDKFHYTGSVGEKKGIYIPYITLNPATGDHIYVFFRDHYLSDLLGFRNNFETEYHAWRNAYEFVLNIANKWFDHSVKTLVLALDGENWMVFSKNPPSTAFFLEKMVDYLVKMDKDNFIKISHLGEMLEEYPAKHVLKYIPTNTWLGTFHKWRGERREQEDYWIKVAESYRILRAYERMIRGEDNVSKSARWVLWHILDSDYWWADFWNPEVITMWLNKFREIMNPILNGIKVREISVLGDQTEGSYASVLVKIENNTSKEIKPVIKIGGLGIEAKRDEDTKPVSIKPKSVYERIIRIRIRSWGKAVVSAALSIDGYIIDNKSITINVKPFIRPNPI